MEEITPTNSWGSPSSFSFPWQQHSGMLITAKYYTQRGCRWLNKTVCFSSLLDLPGVVVKHNWPTASQRQLAPRLACWNVIFVQGCLCGRPQKIKMGAMTTWSKPCRLLYMCCGFDHQIVLPSWLSRTPANTPVSVLIYLGHSLPIIICCIAMAHLLQPLYISQGIFYSILTTVLYWRISSHIVND